MTVYEELEEELNELAFQIGSGPLPSFGEAIERFPAVDSWKLSVVLVVKAQHPTDVPVRPWLSEPSKRTTEPSFSDLIDWIFRGSVEKWRKLYASAKQHPEIRLEIKKALQHTDPWLPDSRLAWEYLLDHLKVRIEGNRRLAEAEDPSE